MMSDTQFAFDQKVWCADGRSAKFVAATPHGFVVKLGYYEPAYNDDDHEYFESVVMVEKIYSAPPIESFDARIAELVAKEAAMNATLDTIRRETLQAKNDARQTMTDLAKRPNLENIEALLAGRITHFVVRMDYNNGLCRIETYDEIMNKTTMVGGRKTVTLRMLALTHIKTNFEWKVNVYEDGSGPWQGTVYPYTCYDDALQKVSQMCLDAVSNLKPSDVIDHRHISVAENATTYGVEIPQWIIDRIAKLQEAVKIKKVAEAEAEFVMAKAKLSSLIA